MGILRKMRAGWKAASTAEKINMVLDVMVGIGSGLISTDIGRKLGEGHTKLGRACIRVAVFGGSLAAGEAASKALKDNYGDIAGKFIDGVKARINESKEEKADE